MALTRWQEPQNHLMGFVEQWGPSAALVCDQEDSIGTSLPQERTLSLGITGFGPEKNILKTSPNYQAGSGSLLEALLGHWCEVTLKILTRSLAV
jgi:hypothetical protein